MNAGSYSLMTVDGCRTKPTFEVAAKKLGVQKEDLDPTFGVVPIDPDAGVYAVQVRSDKVSGQSSDEFHGPFSNPRIEPFGPVKGRK
ncbi:MAG: hypothetical protein ACXWIU_00095 [Limisphaerales bacterium]